MTVSATTTSLVIVKLEVSPSTSTATSTLTSMVTVSVNTLALIYGAIALVYLFGLHRGKEGIKARYQPGGPAKEGIRTWRWQAWLYTIISPTMLIALVLLFVDLFETVHFGG